MSFARLPDDKGRHDRRPTAQGKNRRTLRGGGEAAEKIYKHTEGKEAISPKSTPEELKKFFATVLPEYDRDRVHVSDMKKVVAWYNILVGIGMTDFSIEDEEEPAQEA